MHVPHPKNLIWDRYFTKLQAWRIAFGADLGFLLISKGFVLSSLFVFLFGSGFYGFPSQHALIWFKNRIFFSVSFVEICRLAADTIFLWYESSLIQKNPQNVRFPTIIGIANAS